MLRFYTLLIALVFISEAVLGQTLLQADGEGDTYELINSVLAPGADVVEAPDCGHDEFGRHIEEVFDDELEAYIFKFLIHTDEDDDRCINFDRQRNEIKTYDKSPDELLGVLGEEVVYRWKFKIDEDFQPSSSFTHLHQIKAVGGSEDAMPSITFTARKATPDRLELRYAEALSQVTLKTIELEHLKGIWLDVTETIFYGEIDSGTYDLEIKKWESDSILFSYQSDNIRMWKTDADFMRPKWGIYRSLNDADNLRDESVLFADFSIEELGKGIVDPVDTTTTAILSSYDFIENFDVYPNPTSDYLNLSKMIISNYSGFVLYNNVGQAVVNDTIKSSEIDIEELPHGLYFIVFSNSHAVHKPIKIIKRQ